MAANRDDWSWKLFVVILASGIVWANIPTAEEMNQATFVYFRKPETTPLARCAQNLTILCTRQKVACAAFHVGDDFYVTSAHCLIGPYGKLKDARQLYIYGPGLVDVEYVLHKDFHKFWGVNIAWIIVKDPIFKKQRTTLAVADLLPHHCVRYELALYNTNSTNYRDHFRWYKKDKTPHPTARHEIDTSYMGTLAFVYAPDEKFRKGWEHVVMCSTKENKDVYELHFMFFAVYNKTTTVDLDCHRVKCGDTFNGVRHKVRDFIVWEYYYPDYYIYYYPEKPALRTEIKQYIPPKPEYEYDIPSPYEYIYYYVLFNSTVSLPPKQTSLPVDPPPEIIPSAVRPQATPPTVEKTTKPEPEPNREVEDKFPSKFDYIDDSSKPFTPKTPSKDCNVCCKRFTSYQCPC